MSGAVGLAHPLPQPARENHRFFDVRIRCALRLSASALLRTVPLIHRVSNLSNCGDFSMLIPFPAQESCLAGSGARHYPTSGRHHNSLNFAADGGLVQQKDQCGAY